MDDNDYLSLIPEVSIILLRIPVNICSFAPASANNLGSMSCGVLESHH